jgi:hypothetical protein
LIELYGQEAGLLTAKKITSGETIETIRDITRKNSAAIPTIINETIR